MVNDRLRQALRAAAVPDDRIEGLTLTADGIATAVLAVGRLAAPEVSRLEQAITAALAPVPGVARVRVIQTSQRHQPAAHASPDGLARVTHALAVGAGKGGVGKSTVAVNLALAFRRRGLSVGLLDADIHGPSAQILLGIAARAEGTAEKRLHPVEAHGLKVLGMGLMADPDRAVAWRGPMVSGAVVQMATAGLWGALDLLIVDMPPGTGDIHLAIAQKLRPAGAVIVTTPQRLAVADAMRAAALFRQLDVPVLGAIANMVGIPGSGLHPFGKADPAALAGALGAPVIALLPLDEAVTRASDKGEPLETGPVAAALDAAAATLAAALRPRES